MGGNISSPIQAVLQRQQPQPTLQPGAGYQAPTPANVYRQQQTPYQVSPFVQQQMQMQRMQQMQMPQQIRGLGQQQYVSPLQSMLSRIMSGYNPQQFNPQAMMQQGMPSYGNQMYRPDMAQVQQNLNRVSAPVMPPAPTPAPAPEVAAGGGGE